MNAIFLDIDYVLNGANTKERIQGIPGIEDDKVALLKQLINPDDTIIILTSNWRYHWNKDLGIKDISKWPENEKENYGRYINMKLAKQGLTVSDKTDNIYWSYRAIEIKKWLAKHTIEHFVILDDEDFNWERQGLIKHWVNTSEMNDDYWDEGLTQYHIEKAKKILCKGETK